jgi:hypothetical protein
MRSSEIENACMVVRTPVARAAPGDRSRTRYRGSAARGRRRAFIWSPELGEIFPRCRTGSDTAEKSPRVAGAAGTPFCDRVQVISAVGEITTEFSM